MKNVLKVIILDFIYLSKNYKDFKLETFKNCQTYEDIKKIDYSCILFDINGELFSEIILSDGSILKIYYENDNKINKVCDMEIVIKNYINPENLELLTT